MKMKQLWNGKACGLVLAVVVGVSLMIPAPVLAKFPEKPITIICPWGPGGTTDIASRVFAKNLSRVWGVNVNVVNKPGGNTVIGTMELNNSKPDGYTVMMDNRDSTSLPYVSDNLPFKILDRTWMNEIAYTPYLLTVPANSKFQNLKDIVAAIKSDPKRFRVPSLGGAGTQDFFGRQFLKAIGVEYKDVSLVMGKSGNDIMIFTAQGSVDIGQVGAAAAKPQLDAKTVRPIAIAGTGGKRLDWLPNVPTFDELGYPQINAVFWVGLSGPPGLPKPLVETWNETVRKLVVEDKEFLADLDKVGLEPKWRDQEEVIKYVKEQLEVSRQLWGAK